MKELAALAYRDTTAENRDFWKNEMGNALREIQAAYDEKLDGLRAELEAHYNMKVDVQQNNPYLFYDFFFCVVCVCVCVFVCQHSMHGVVAYCFPHVVVASIVLLLVSTVLLRMYRK